MKHSPEIVLASASPRRAELLKSIGATFRIIPSSAEEESWTGVNPAAYARSLALAKARAVAAQERDAIVIGADTIVVCDGQVLGKPADNDDAIRMLRSLSGRSHEVITGVVVVAGVEPYNGQIFIAHERTKVVFRPLSDQEIIAYVATGEPCDKAGAYGIQGMASLFVSRIEGCYFNVVGLPLRLLGMLLSECGVKLLTRQPVQSVQR